MQATALALMLLLRIYDVSLTPPRDARVATQVASRILNKAGVETAWVVCRNYPVTVPGGSPCGRSLAPAEVVIRLLSSSRHLSGEALGNAYVDTAAGGGSLATVYLDRVATLAEEASLDLATLLGRAIAHEVGHLLLGTTSHSPTGLMRAAWTGELLKRRIGEDWQFSRNERVTLARHLTDRLQAPVSGLNRQSVRELRATP